jgi:hypothetical protein
MLGERIIELLAYLFSLLTADGRKSFGVEDEESLAVMRLMRDFRVSHWL